MAGQIDRNLTKLMSWWCTSVFTALLPLMFQEGAGAGKVILGQEGGVTLALLAGCVIAKRQRGLSLVCWLALLHTYGTGVAGVALLGGVGSMGFVVMLVTIPVLATAAHGKQYGYSLGVVSVAVITSAAVFEEHLPNEKIPAWTHAVLVLCMMILVLAAQHLVVLSQRTSVLPLTKDDVVCACTQQHHATDAATVIVCQTNQNVLVRPPGLVIESEEEEAAPAGPLPLQPRLQLMCSVDKASQTSSSAVDERCEEPRTLAKTRIRDSSFTTNINNPSPVKIIKKTFNWKKGDLIGQGGFGKVHIGLNSETGELMAVKNVEFCAGDSNVMAKMRQLQKEIEIMKPLDHTHVVRYFFTERVGSSINIFMEYVPGGSLQKLLRTFGPLNETTAVQYTYQILLGLAHLHAQGIIHRDIKCANILLTVDGFVKVADFGASAIVESKDGIPGVQGTPYWMAPEVITARGHNWQADIWSLGCTVMEMLCARPPWMHLGIKTQVGVLRWIVNENGDSTGITLPSGLTCASETFLKACLQRDPELRPTATKLIEHHYFTVDAEEASRDSSQIGTVFVQEGTNVVRRGSTLTLSPKGKWGELIKESSKGSAKRMSLPLSVCETVRSCIDCNTPSTEAAATATFVSTQVEPPREWSHMVKKDDCLLKCSLGLTEELEPSRFKSSLKSPNSFVSQGSPGVVLFELGEGSGEKRSGLLAP